MTRLGLAFTILTIGAAAVLPDVTTARPAARAAFTLPPTRIVLPSFRPRIGGHLRFHHMGPGPQMTHIPHAITRSVAEGRHAFRRHRFFSGYPYVTTFGDDSSFFGTPYDPSDIPVYGPISEQDDPPPAFTPPATVSSVRYPAPTDRPVCRSETVTVPLASGTGEREVTIVRC